MKQIILILIGFTLLTNLYAEESLQGTYYEVMKRLDAMPPGEARDRFAEKVMRVMTERLESRTLLFPRADLDEGARPLINRDSLAERTQKNKELYDIYEHDNYNT